jgi:predicted RNase H-like HicB family nuclease
MSNFLFFEDVRICREFFERFKMVNKISIVISKNPDGYSVKFPELEPIDYQDSSLEDVLNRLKEALETHLISSDISQGETTVESILKVVDKLNLNLPEEELSQLPSEGKEIMKFAGIWEDLPEEDLRNFCEEVEQRRQN